MHCNNLASQPSVHKISFYRERSKGIACSIWKSPCYSTVSWGNRWDSHWNKTTRNKFSRLHKPKPVIRFTFSSSVWLPILGYWCQCKMARKCAWCEGVHKFFNQWISEKWDNFLYAKGNCWRWRPHPSLFTWRSCPSTLALFNERVCQCLIYCSREIFWLLCVEQEWLLSLHSAA